MLGRLVSRLSAAHSVRAETRVVVPSNPSVLSCAGNDGMRCGIEFRVCLGGVSA